MTSYFLFLQITMIELIFEYNNLRLLQGYVLSFSLFWRPYNEQNLSSLMIEFCSAESTRDDQKPSVFLQVDFRLRQLTVLVFFYQHKLNIIIQSLTLGVCYVSFQSVLKTLHMLTIYLKAIIDKLNTKIWDCI